MKVMQLQSMFQFQIHLHAIGQNQIAWQYFYEKLPQIMSQVRKSQRVSGTYR